MVLNWLFRDDGHYALKGASFHVLSSLAALSALGSPDWATRTTSCLEACKNLCFVVFLLFLPLKELLNVTPMVSR